MEPCQFTQLELTLPPMPPTSTAPPSVRSTRDEALVLDEAIIEAARHLATGGTVAIPTETVYGLAARIDSAEGINAIFLWLSPRLI